MDWHVMLPLAAAAFAAGGFVGYYFAPQRCGWCDRVIDGLHYSNRHGAALCVACARFFKLKRRSQWACIRVRKSAD